MRKSTKKTTQNKFVHRLQIIGGHVAAIQKMIENDEYCVDIVHQSQAVQRALKKLDRLLLEEHINECVVHQIQTGQTKRTTDELLRLFDYK
ncbi:MAG: metal-sensitive transcriptional regulator [Candidatus Komeilibacteria bacterium]|nr:metal-sensitive transcriptional regulator [Candidatus Komeilibacteria bacterium]